MLQKAAGIGYTEDMPARPGSKNLKLLIDTNILIPVEPTSSADLEAQSELIANMLRAAAEGKHDIYIHPLIRLDLSRDKDDARRRARELLIKKYRILPDAPPLTTGIKHTLGEVPDSSHDFVDHSLLAALDADAVDFLVTEDRKIRTKGQRLGLVNRIATVQETLAILSRLGVSTPSLPPAVRQAAAHVLDKNDPIFASLRRDYSPDFDRWLTGCKREHRTTLLVEAPGKRGLAGVCILKEESQAPIGPNGNTLGGSILKVCTFKVSEEHHGLRYGELLLKTLFGIAAEKQYDFLYVTCFEKYTDLIILLEEFGFRRTGGRERLGDLIFVKRLKWTEEERLGMSPLAFHVAFGPEAIDTRRAPFFLVPIQPHFHDLLFPEAATQKSLIVGADPFGNAIRKAYLCNSSIKKVEPGSLLFFYRSEDAQSVSVLGIAEDTLVSDSAPRIAQFVGKRTVYPLKDIAEMCSRPVLAILFRQARILQNPISIAELIKAGVLLRAPQSITTVREERKPWIATRIAGSR